MWWRSGHTLGVSLLCGALTASSCFRSSSDDMFKDRGCTLGEEGCGCRADRSCNPSLACYSDLCVAPNGAGGSGAGVPGGNDGAGSGGTTEGGAGSDDMTGSGGEATGGTGGVGAASGGAGPGENLVENGDFDDGETLWTFEPAPASYSISNGALCVSIGAGESVSLGWPSNTSHAFALSAGQSYTFSYVASSSGPLGVSVTSKIGHALPPYTTHFEQGTSVSSTPQSYSHAFDVVNADAGAGLVFSMTGAEGEGTTTVCFDDVSVLETP
jgi:hypothetical protein